MKTLKVIEEEIKALLDKESKARRDMQRQMIGSLYPSVLEDEIAKIYQLERMVDDWRRKSA